MQETRHGTRNQGLPFFNAATAASQLHWLAVIATAVAALMSAPAQADQWSLLINGKTVHLDKPAGIDLNEENWGAGVQYDFNMTKGKPSSVLPSMSSSVGKLRFRYEFLFSL